MLQKAEFRKELFETFSSVIKSSVGGAAFLKQIEKDDFEPTSMSSYANSVIFKMLKPIQKVGDVIQIPPPNLKNGRKGRVHHPVITGDEFVKEAKQKETDKFNKSEAIKQRKLLQIKKKIEKEKSEMEIPKIVLRKVGNKWKRQRKPKEKSVKGKQKFIAYYF
jgi:hypothetical protein